MFELNGNRTLADLQTEVEALTDRLGMAEELAELHATEKDVMASRYDKVIKEMRAEVDEANILWDAHLQQWESNQTDKWMTTWRKMMILSTYAILILAFVLAVSN